MRTAVVGGVLLIVGAISVAVGVLPPSHLATLFERVWPILVFVSALTVVAELAAAAGVFDAIAEQTARIARGSGVVLWLFVVVLATLCTAFFSLDTTAVLLTPVVIVLARHVGMSPIPFALTTVLLANTASLFLPISNLTNLLALQPLGHPTPAAFLALTWAPALAAVVITSAAVFLTSRRQLVVRYVQSERSDPDDRVLFRWSLGVIIVLVPLLVSGVPVWISACAAAAVLVVVFAVRRHTVLRFTLVPWQLILFACGLFVVVDAAHVLGLGRILATVAGTGSGPFSLLRLAGSALVGANAVNNLPAYLMFEPLAHTPARVLALLIGTNAGAVITPWSSLAILLWHARVRSMGETIPWRRYVALALVVAPVCVLCSTLLIAR